MTVEVEAFPTSVWVSRVQGLQSHLRIIRDGLDGVESPAARRAIRQAVVGIAEGDRYVSDCDWVTYRGWLIEQTWLNEWEATHPDFDPTPVHLYDGPSDNRHVVAKTRDGVIEEIDLWIEENGS